MKRLFDIMFSLGILILSLPFLLGAALAVRISSPGPIMYRAVRVGLNGQHFEMLKFRTMHVATGGSVITSKGDARIFTVGSILRKLKIDELPQFLNVLTGEMSVVGPRPEDPKMVDEHYSDWMLETLNVRPGITSPGAVFYYTQGEGLVDDDEPEMSYVQKLLPPKLAIERAYLERANLLADVRYIILTGAAIFGQATGAKVRVPREDKERALRWVDQSAFPPE